MNLEMCGRLQEAEQLLTGNKDDEAFDIIRKTSIWDSLYQDGHRLRLMALYYSKKGERAISIGYAVAAIGRFEVMADSDFRKSVGYQDMRKEIGMCEDIIKELS